MWYEVKVKYTKIDDNDRVKTFNQPYLFDALTFTEAEARANEEMGKYLSEGFKITNIKVANYTEIFPNENGDRWFKCKVSLITLDEEKGMERRTNIYVLVQANDVKNAYDNLIEQFADSVSDFSIPVIQESPIIDIFPFFDGEEPLEEPKVIYDNAVENDEILEEEYFDDEYIEENSEVSNVLED